MLRFEKERKWLREHKKEILFLAVLLFLLLLLQWSGTYRTGKALVREDNQVVAIERQNLAANESFPLCLEVEKNGKKVIYNVTLTLEGIQSEAEKDADSSHEKENRSEEKETLQNAIESVVERIEEEEGTLILLPSKLEDGTGIAWKQQKNVKGLLIILLFPLGMYFIYRSELQKTQKEGALQKVEIRKALPGFNDQLLLLLNAGLIFQDAFYRIVSNYEKREKQDGFSVLMGKIKRESDVQSKTVVTVMKASSASIGLREYARMVNLIADHQYRGVDLKEKLQQESHLLWEMRKSAAMQKGKEIETRLTFPLAVLLLVLIIIAGVPALMNM